MDSLTPSLEDYLEAIYLINLGKKVVRVKDVVEFLKVKTPSVIGAVKVLEKKGLVMHERYGYIELTDDGILEAKKIYEKHETLSKFFHEILGIDLKIAREDACRVEHHIGEKTMNKFIKFINFIETCPEGTPLWVSNFHYFAKYGKHPEHCKIRESRVE